MAEVSIEEKNNAVIVSVSGEITMTTVNEIDFVCKPYVNSDIEVIAIDLKLVMFIDSFGISRIIKISKAFSAQNKTFVLINMNENIHQIFKIATFDKLFTIMTKPEFMMTYMQ